MYAWTLICKELSKVREEELSKVRNASELKHKEVDPLMNAPPGCANLPLDEKILNKVLMLLNLTMSEHLIKAWIKKVLP